MTQCKFCQGEKIPNQLLTFRSCKHTCICQDCYFKTRMEKFYQPDSTDSVENNRRNMIRCLICREETIYVVGASTAKMVSRMVDTEKQEPVYLTLQRYLRSLRLGNIVVDGIVNTIHETYMEYFQANGSGVFLSVNQCESLLKIASEKNIFEIDGNSRYVIPKAHMIRNMLVALCIHPWNVDQRLGVEGVCYHGNFGDDPGLAAAFALLQRNHFAHKYNNFF